MPILKNELSEFNLCNAQRIELIGYIHFKMSMYEDALNYYQSCCILYEKALKNEITKN